MRIDRQMIVLGLLSAGRYTVDLEKGNVISLIGKEPRVMAGLTLPTGYKQVGLDMGYGNSIMVFTHQVMYLAEYGSYNPKYTIDHRDRNPSNNCIYNLNCGSHADNVANTEKRAGKRAFKPRKTEQEKQRMVEMYLAGNSAASIAREFKCANANIYVILKNRGVYKGRNTFDGNEY